MDDAKISEIYNKYQTLDKAEIIKNGDSTNLNAIQDEVDKIYEWINEYYVNSAYRNQLPSPTRSSIEGEFENASNLFEQIVQMRNSDIAQFATQKSSFIDTVKNYYRSLYDAFVRDYRGWKLEYSQADRIKELDTIVADAKKRQKNIQAQEKAVEKQADATAELAQDIGLSELAKYFYQLVYGDNEWMNNKKPWTKWAYDCLKFFRGYQGAAHLWLILALLAFGTAFLIAYSELLPFVRELSLLGNSENKSSNATLVYAILITKSLVLIVPIYAIRFCLKNYGSNKHLAADALHKAKALQTLPTFLAIPRNDEAAIREIATAVAQVIFTPTTTGFIAQKGDYDNTGITIKAPQIKA